MPIVTPSAELAAFEGRLDSAFTANARTMEKFGRVIFEVSNLGLTSVQFHLFRANYLYRSVTTVYTVAATVAAALNHEPPALEAAKRALYGALVDELGAPTDETRSILWTGTERESHIALLFRCLNSFSRECFPGLRDLVESDCVSGDQILSASLNYRVRQRSLFDPSDYLRTLGAAYGQEAAAHGMLSVLRDALFIPLLPRVPEAERQAAMKYFDVHLAGEHGDAERNHGEEARRSIQPLLDDPTTAEKVCAAAEESLALQSEFFFELGRALTNAG